ncbi:hypothetical protein [Aquimarina algiphila]|nr:hypothetical protein [Aquimarina algiphila]
MRLTIQPVHIEFVDRVPWILDENSFENSSKEFIQKIWLANVKTS